MERRGEERASLLWLRGDPDPCWDDFHYQADITTLPRVLLVTKLQPGAAKHLLYLGLLDSYESWPVKLYIYCRRDWL